MTVKNMKVQLRRDTASNWTTENPVLLSGEMGIESDTNKFKFGDGNKTWEQLDYASAGSSGGNATWGNISGTLSEQTDLNTALEGKQPTLVSGTNIKTINNQSILGEGNIEIQGGLGDATWGSITGTLSEQTDLAEALDTKISRTSLVSSENKKVLTLTGIPISVDLDTVIYDNKSLRTIFETNNIFKDNIGFEEGTLDPLTYTTTTRPTIDSTHADIGTYCAAIAHTGSQQLGWENTNPAGTVYYFACRVNCTRYVKGYLGIIVGSNASDSASVNHVTEGYETVTGKGTSTGGNPVFLGSFSAANLDGYIDMPVIIQASSFTTAPSEEKFNELYELYLEVKKNGQFIIPSEEILIDARTSTPEVECTDAQAEALFVSEMNALATKLGMTQTHYEVASGGSNLNTTTTQDTVRVGIKGLEYPQLVEVWNCPAKTVKSTGRVTVNNLKSTVVDHDGWADVLKTDYWFIGGKTGSWINRCNYVITLEDKKTGDQFTICNSWAGSETASKNRFTACKKIADIARLLRKAGENNITNSDDIQDSATKAAVKEIETALFAEVNNATVILTPAHPAGYDNCPLYDGSNIRHIYSYNGTSTFYTASMSKVMTSILTLRWIDSIYDTYTLKSSDIEAGSGPVFAGGETFTYEDALYLLMLPSSNTTAKAMSRVIGHKMYNVLKRA